METADVDLVPLAAWELYFLIEALDTYEYWELGHVLPRNDGAVFLPDDLFADRYWGDRDELTPAEEEAVEAVTASRALGEKLQRVLNTFD